MNKGLEEIKTLRGFNQVELNNDNNINKSLDIIEEELQRLEAIENAKPSEALENFKRIKNIQVCVDYEKDIFKNVNEMLPKSCYSVEQALIKAQEQENILRIFVEKPLSLLALRLLKKYDKDGVLELDYQTFVDCYKVMTEDFDEDMKEQIVTEEEINLLKRYFEDE